MWNMTLKVNLNLGHAINCDECMCKGESNPICLSVYLFVSIKISGDPGVNFIIASVCVGWVSNNMLANFFYLRICG